MPKSFQARRECIQRTYDYLLPARVLGIGAAGGAAVAWPGTAAAAGRDQSEVGTTAYCPPRHRHVF